MLIRPLILRAKRFAFVAIAALFVAAAVAPAAVAYTWSWGYNYMGASVNSYESGGYNYYTTGYLDKKSGGLIVFGWGPSGSCWSLAGGTTSWSGTPSDLGCGGYIYPYVEWGSGATSYLYFSSST